MTSRHTKDAIRVISAVVPSIPGWCTVEKACNLASLVFALRPELVVEIGVWAGKSLYPLALSISYLGRGKVIAIDPWSPAESIKNQSAPNVAWWNKQREHDAAEQRCRKLIAQSELNPVVDFVKKPSNAVEPPENIGILHVDGNHSLQSIQDVERFGRQVAPGGFMVIDDLDWDNQGPLHSMKVAKSIGFSHLYTVDSVEGNEKDNYAVLQRITTGS